MNELAPSAWYRQHHEVEAPRVDDRHFRPAWRVLTRLDGLLADRAITAAEWHAAADYRELVDQVARGTDPLADRTRLDRDRRAPGLRAFARRGARRAQSAAPDPEPPRGVGLHLARSRARARPVLGRTRPTLSLRPENRAGLGDHCDQGAAHGLRRTIMATQIIPDTSGALLFSVEYDATGLATATVYDNPLLGWAVDDTATQPTPVIIGILPLMPPSTAPIISPQWAKYYENYIFVPDVCAERSMTFLRCSRPITVRPGRSKALSSQATARLRGRPGRRSSRNSSRHEPDRGRVHLHRLRAADPFPAAARSAADGVHDPSFRPKPVGRSAQRKSQFDPKRPLSFRDGNGSSCPKAGIPVQHRVPISRCRTAAHEANGT